MTTADTATMRGGRVRVPRSRGALSGVLLVLLGAWGAIVPFIGPYFSFGYTPDSAWTWTAGRGWLEVLPGAVVLVAGLIMLLSANRVVAGAACWFAIAGGAWFVIGPQLAAFMGVELGVPTASSTGMRALEALAYFYALGVVIVLLAAAALGRLSVHSVGDWRAAQRRAAVTEPGPVGTGPAVATAPAGASAAAASPADASAADEDAAAREHARRAIAREQNDHAHRHFLRSRRDRDAERETDPVSAGGDQPAR
jgi:hypothetical protein